MSDLINSTRFALDLTPTHPHFWPLRTKKGLNVWVGKQFVSTTGRYIWSVSGPLAGSARQLHYCDATAANRNFCVGDSFEWEQWVRLDNRLGKVLQFGGPTPATSHWHYPTRRACQTKTFAGVIWPSLAPGQTYAYRNTYVDDGCRPGSYIAVIRDTYTSKSALAQWLFSQYPPAQRMVSNSVQVHLVYQGYNQLIGDQTFVGCEAIVYISGYPTPVTTSTEDSLAVRRYFRNGEVRIGGYMALPGPAPAPAAPGAAAWWKSQSAVAFTQAENLIYTGVYKLGATTYFDSGAP